MWKSNSIMSVHLNIVLSNKLWLAILQYLQEYSYGMLQKWRILHWSNNSLTWNKEIFLKWQNIRLNVRFFKKAKSADDGEPRNSHWAPALLSIYFHLLQCKENNNMHTMKKLINNKSGFKWHTCSRIHQHGDKRPVRVHLSNRVLLINWSHSCVYFYTWITWKF